MADANKQNKWNPGMNSDSEPQPIADPDFGAGMEYESGDRDRDFAEAERIRKEWEANRKPEA